MLLLDLRRLGRWLATPRPSAGPSPLDPLRTLLSMCLTFGLNAEIDEICAHDLGILRPEVGLMIGNISSAHENYQVWHADCEYNSTETSLPHATGEAVWRVSAEMTGIRQLLIVSLLRPFLDSPGQSIPD